MALSSSTILAILELVFYVPFTLITIYLLIKHRLPGLLGNLYFIIFLSLRLATSGLEIANRNKPTSTTAAILNSIGISPLLLTLAGFLHEAASYSNPSRNKLLGIVLQIFVHIAAISGVALAAVGGSDLAKPETARNRYSADHRKQEGGALLMFLVWILLCIYAVWTLHRSQRSRAESGASSTPLAKRLLISSAIATPFIGLRALYTIIYSFDHSPSVSPVQGTFAYHFIFIFLAQLTAAACLLMGGLLSRNIVASTRERQIRTSPEAGLPDHISPNDFGLPPGPESYPMQYTRK